MTALATLALPTDGALPVIAPSLMAYEDLATVRALGARAVSFGAIHLRTPWRPTAIAKRDLAERAVVPMTERRAA
jgi:hypothetical protein